jgi:hypothetical protein
MNNASRGSLTQELAEGLTDALIKLLLSKANNLSDFLSSFQIRRHIQLGGTERAPDYLGAFKGGEQSGK